MSRSKLWEGAWDTLMGFTGGCPLPHMATPQFSEPLRESQLLASSIAFREGSVWSEINPLRFWMALWENERASGWLGLSLDHRITASLRLEKVSKIIKSSHQCNSSLVIKPCLRILCPQVFGTPPGTVTFTECLMGSPEHLQEAWDAKVVFTIWL